MKYPKGPGMFVWQSERCGGKDPLKFAHDLHEMGISWVALKVADGVDVNAAWQEARWSVAMLRPIVAALRAYGMQVWGWHYVYGYSPLIEANVGADRCQALNLDGYIIDAESEYCLPGRTEAARQYMGQLRKRLGWDYPLALCSYRYISYHRDFAWDGFMGVNMWMPQVYWMLSHNSGYQLRKSYLEYMAFKRLPLIPVGAAFHESGWAPTSSELVDFVETAKSLGLSGYSWWELYDIQERPEWGDTIKLVSGYIPGDNTDPVTPPPPPIPVDNSYKVQVTAWLGLNYRATPSLSGQKLGAYPYRTELVIDLEQDDWGRVKDKNHWVMLTYTKKV